MLLLRKIFLPLLTCTVLATLWVTASERSVRVPHVMRPDGTQFAVYGCPVARLRVKQPYSSRFFSKTTMLSA